MECMFDHACTIKSKFTPSTPTKNEDNSLADLQSQNLSMKSENELQKDDIHELEVRLLQRESEIEKLRKQLIDQQFANTHLEKRKNIRVMTTDELMVHGRRVQDGHYVVKRYCLNILNNKFSLQWFACFQDSFPFKQSMLDSLAKNTTVSNFIRQLMRKMYTSEYLSLKTMKNMKKEHVAAITGV